MKPAALFLLSLAFVFCGVSFAHALPEIRDRHAWGVIALYGAGSALFLTLALWLAH